MTFRDTSGTGVRVHDYEVSLKTERIANAAARSHHWTNLSRWTTKSRPSHILAQWHADAAPMPGSV